MGAGRTAISSGIGPFSVSQTIGGSRSSTSRSGYGGGAYYRDYGPSQHQLNKQAEAQDISNRIKRLTEAHLVKFPSATKKQAGQGPVPSVSQLTNELRAAKLKGIGLLKRRERALAKESARLEALAEHSRLLALEDQYRQKAQKILDEEWNQLVNNDFDSVMYSITQAFGDNEAKSALLTVAGSKASIVVVAPDVSIIPEKDWSITNAGNLSVRKRSASSRDAAYFDMIFSQLVATLNEAFAVAPGIKTIDMILVRNGSSIKLNRQVLQALAFGSFSLEKLKLARSKSSAYSILQEAAISWRDSIDNNLKFKPLSLDHEPDIAELILQLSSSD